MNIYEDLLIEADEEGILVREAPLESGDGRCKGNRIAIRENIPTLAQKANVLAEELGHYYTSSGNILDMDDVQNRKQERKARLWAYDKQVGLLGLIRAYEHGCQGRYGLADFLEVTEEFLQEAIDCYTSKYGELVTIDNYIIRFVPNLGVMRLFYD